MYQSANCDREASLVSNSDKGNIDANISHSSEENITVTWNWNISRISQFKSIFMVATQFLTLTINKQRNRVKSKHTEKKEWMGSKISD
jgi:hypothetical protein